MIASEITQGDSLSWSENETDYPASSSWVVHYVLVNAGNRITFNSSADGDKHDFDITTATTSTWRSGEYTFQRYVTDGTDRVTLDTGTVTIIKDFAVMGDRRTHAVKVLESIEAVLENRATVDQESYTINGRSLSRMPIEELLKFRDIYRAEVSREKRAERLAQGLGTRQTIKVRF